MAVRLFVGNLPYDVTEAELRAHFAAIGPLAYLSLAMDRDTGKPRGFAFVEFSARADAEDAMRRLDNHLFKGRPLAVNEARARDAPAPPSAPRPAGPRPPSAARSAPSTSARPDRYVSAPETRTGTRRRCAAQTVRGTAPTRTRTTPRSALAGVHARNEPWKRGRGWRKKHEQPFKNGKRNAPASKSSTTKRSGGWRPKSIARQARRAWKTMSWNSPVWGESPTERRPRARQGRLHGTSGFVPCGLHGLCVEGGAARASRTRTTE
jgi:RNA recognition motif-containing protein